MKYILLQGIVINKCNIVTFSQSLKKQTAVFIVKYKLFFSPLPYLIDTLLKSGIISRMKSICFESLVVFSGFSF